MSAIFDQLPSQTQLQASLSDQTADSSFSPPTSQISSVNLNEKASENLQASSLPPPPPSYSAEPPVLSIATALYAYTPTDAGDLALQPNDRVQVLEHMNNDCTDNPSFLLKCLAEYPIPELVLTRLECV